ncbi:uncharacterized protein B0P05DRAFT_537306 [Gilbertella persicaria]|uniref:uncharacterized protein n=1 Tax=Gilbertella persicaria TaxID=101096 RepID=UPI00221E803B|nr:uncharacterized protein B0P05DRAFT_537306 [Gilbertella persicaria]KAI8082500.1 hypothetical protein B0P05DRAFT_537306 [Gilbertella persicaria]
MKQSASLLGLMKVLGLAAFQQGLQTSGDFQKYYVYLSGSKAVTINDFDPLLKTTNQELLISIGKSMVLGKLLRQTLENALKSWQIKTIETLLKVLNHIPFEIDVLVRNSLGFLVKDVKREAISKEAPTLVEITNFLIDKWKEQQKRNSLNANGKRDSSTIQTCYSKRAPARPKAIEDTSFFSNLRETKKYPLNARPVYHVDKILDDMTKSEKANVSKKTMTNTTIPTSSSSFTIGQKRAAAEDFTPKVVDPNRKRVRFKDNLVEIREYERNPEEWTSFETTEENDTTYNPELAIVDGIRMYKAPPSQIAWYTPYTLVFDTDSNPNLVIPKPVHSSEAMAQERREKLALAATYISLQHIPPSPTEPDEIPNPNEDGTVTIIPLTDTDVSTVSTVTIPSPPSNVNPSLLTPANLTVAAAIAAAMKESQLQQPQPQQVYTSSVPSSSIPTTTNYYPSVYTPPPPLPPQQTTATVAPVVPKNPQPEITNQAVENMLKNTPGIMQQLKQLSFLANSGTFAAVNNQPQTNSQPQMTYQPQYQQQQQQQQYQAQYQLQPQQPSWSRANEAYTNNQLNGRNKKPRRMNKKNNGPAGNGRPACNFYNTPEGCRNGDNCPFAH